MIIFLSLVPQIDAQLSKLHIIYLRTILYLLTILCENFIKRTLLSRNYRENIITMIDDKL